jgi:hypothetical protein
LTSNVIEWPNGHRHGEISRAKPLLNAVRLSAPGRTCHRQ